MNDRRLENDQQLDQLLAEIRDEKMPADAEKAAMDRVWSRLGDEVAAAPAEHALRGCADFQALIPALLAGELPPARALLVSDHTRECVPCRRALMSARTAGAAAATQPARGFRVPVALRWAAALLLASSAVLLGGRVVGDRLAEQGLQARVEAANGSLQLVSDSGSKPLGVGSVVRARQSLRTADGAGALLRLPDGSAVELDQRSELQLRASRRGTRIALARGSVIVHAAPQGSRRLAVETADCRVTVKGTIFAVKAGVKGSRVSVIEGEVAVQDHGSESTLLPGQQVTTDARLANVPVEEEIAWSRDADQYLALLGELGALKREIEQRASLPDRRTSTRLLDLCPPDTVVFAALPNVSEGLVTARQVLAERLAASDTLRKWWDEYVVKPGLEQQLQETLDRLQALGLTLGEEVVVALPATVSGGEPRPLALAVVDDPTGFASLLATEVERINTEAGRQVLRIVTDLEQPEDSGVEGWLWLHDDLFAAAANLGQLRELAARVAGADNPFLQSELHNRLATAYHDGVGFLCGLDLHTIMASAGEADDQDVLQRLGLLDATTLVIEHHREAGRGATQAALDFAAPRHGMAAWLAEPAPMGSLEFVSPQAVLAAAAVSRDTRDMVDEVLDLLATTDPTFVDKLAAFEREHAIDVRADLAAPLGGEAAFALDGTLLPTPAWKLVVEVYDPAGLEHAVDWAVGEVNRALAADGKPQLETSSETVGGRVFHVIRHPQVGFELHWVLADGYLVAAPQRVLLEQALAYRASGTSLPHSAAFRDLLPANGYTDCSALLYRNFTGVADAVAGSLLKSAQPQAATLLSELAEPSLVCVFGEERRLVLSGTGGSLLGALPLLGMPAVMQPPHPVANQTPAADVSSAG